MEFGQTMHIIYLYKDNINIYFSTRKFFSDPTMLSFIIAKCLQQIVITYMQYLVWKATQEVEKYF
jgi:hypothetical protein